MTAVTAARPPEPLSPLTPLGYIGWGAIIIGYCHKYKVITSLTPSLRFAIDVISCGAILLDVSLRGQRLIENLTGVSPHPSFDRNEEDDKKILLIALVNKIINVFWALSTAALLFAVPISPLIPQILMGAGFILTIWELILCKAKRDAAPQPAPLPS